MSTTLHDTTAIKLQIVEDKAPSGLMVVRGEFGRCDIPTANGRVYPRKIVESNLSSLRSDLERRRVFGELDHPDDGRTKLQRVSHVITKLDIDKDGRVIGEAEILDTEFGRALKAIISANCEVGVSSRGTGSTRRREDGIDEVMEDFRLKTYDFVFDPATKTAYPEVVRESIDAAERAYMSEDYKLPPEVQAVVEEASAKQPDAEPKVDIEAVKAEAVEEAKAAFAASLPDLLAKAKEEGAKAAVEAAMHDPANVAAKTVLEAVVGIIRPLVAPGSADHTKSVEDDLTAARDLARSQELQIADLRLRLREAEEENLSIRVAGMVSEALRDQKRPDAMRRAFGPTRGFRSIDEAKTKLDALIEDFGEKAANTEVEELRTKLAESEAARAKLVEQNASLSTDLAEARTEIAKLTEDVSETRKRLHKAVEIGLSEATGRKLAESKVSAVASLFGRTDANRVFSLVEACETVKDVERTLREHPERSLTEDVQERIRSRVRRGVETNSPLQEEDASSNGAQFVVHPSMKLDLDELRGLAGITS